MLPSLSLAIATLLAAQPADGPKLTRGQELVYRGNYSETSKHDGSPFSKSYELETVVFIRDVGQNGLAAAFCTTLKLPESTKVGAARFELANVDPTGRVRLPSGEPPPLFPAGPPVVECAGFVARPKPELDTWTDDLVHPPVTWRVVGTESVHGVRCSKLMGIQDSHWDINVANRPSWRRTETVWIGNSTGIVERLEREFEFRSAGSPDNTVKSRTAYELQGGITTYPDPLGQDRQHEILQAAQFQAELRRLQSGRGFPASAYKKLIERIDQHIDATPATPFRAAIKVIRQRVEAAQRGEPPPPGGS